MPAIEVNEDFLKAIEDAVAYGAKTNQQIADSLNVPLKTFERIKSGSRKNGTVEMRGIEESIKRGQKRVFEEVGKIAKENLQKVLKGYEYTEKSIEVSDTRGTTEKTITKYAKPDTTALIFAMKEMRDEEERKREAEQGLTKDQLELLPVELLKQIQEHLPNA